MDTLEYILTHFNDCVKENRSDNGNFIGLPYPYTVPAIGYFDNMYYWDTYFTNVGLFVCGCAHQAKNNVDNMLYLVDKYGFMPNGNRTFFLSRSQPPFLSEMVKDVYEYYKDPVWLKSAYEGLNKEYNFWQTGRITGIGLNQYGGCIDNENEFCNSFVERVGYNPEIESSCLARHSIAQMESGWDISPRMGCESYNCCEVDLNSLLYMHEKNMEYFSLVLKNNDEDKWHNAAEIRKELMCKYMYNEDNMPYDYNFQKKCLCDVYSAAAFYPMFAKCASEKQAKSIADNIDMLEYAYGISACADNNVKGVYQWNYPNGWACLQYIAAKGLANYGYHDDAIRIIKKYVAAIDKIYGDTGKLWEKYNVTDGSINVVNEYEMPEMMGWTAGVYLWCLDYLKRA